jgi:cysteine desulfurase
MVKTSAFEPIYLDHQATTPVDPRVVRAMSPYWEVEFGNPHSSKHAFGWRADDAVQQARQSVAALIGADADEIVFTSGATEANNLAILGLLGHAKAARTGVVVSAIEHKCVLQSARQLSRLGYEVVLAPVRSTGHVDIDALDDLIDGNTALVSIMAVNNEIGTIQSVEEISALCRKAGTILHTDAAQAGVAMTIDVDGLGVDMMSLSAHKLYGPKGIGALYVSHSVRERLRPIIHGGGQEGGLRSGTLPAPLCVGFGAAAEISRMEFGADTERSKLLRSVFLQTLRSEFADFEINGGVNGHPGNLNLRFPGIDADILTANLQPRLAISTGAACASGIPEPSHVLRAIGLTAEQAGECVRIGFGRFTDEQQARNGAHFLAEVALSMMCVG